MKQAHAVACDVGHPITHNYHDSSNTPSTLSDLPRRAVYDLPSVPLEVDSNISPPAILALADSLFPLIQQAPSYKRSKVSGKRKYWRQLVHAASRAAWLGGCVRYERHLSKTSSIQLQVIACAVDAGLLHECRSPRGFSEKCSRLLPTELLDQFDSDNPAEFDPQPAEALVEVWLRGKGKKRRRLPFDTMHPVAVETERKLTQINAANSNCDITFLRYNLWEDKLDGIRRLVPTHYARFCEHFGLHGRLYTRRYGHQSLRKLERQTIRFDGVPGVELDYRGMHPRMLYHRQELNYDGDPYALWGAGTTPAQRLLAKLVINTAINAKSRKAALLACHNKARETTKGGKSKEGRKLETARRINDALRKTSLTFRQVYDLALAVHRPIARYINSDYGVTLMRWDSAIALDVLHSFSERGIPCLGVHDSFIVPEPHADELRRVMVDCYRTRFGFRPEIKG